MTIVSGTLKAHSKGEQVVPNGIDWLTLPARGNKRVKYDDRSLVLLSLYVDKSRRVRKIYQRNRGIHRVVSVKSGIKLYFKLRRK